MSQKKLNIFGDICVKLVHAGTDKGRKKDRKESIEVLMRNVATNTKKSFDHMKCVLDTC